MYQTLTTVPIPSAVMAGFDTIEIKSTEEGLVDIESLKAALSDEVAD